jgi:hypothetical protein
MRAVLIISLGVGILVVDLGKIANISGLTNPFLRMEKEDYFPRKGDLLDSTYNQQAKEAKDPEEDEEERCEEEGCHGIHQVLLARISRIRFCQFREFNLKMTNTQLNLPFKSSERRASSG